MTPQSNLQQYSYGDSTLTISRKGETENTSLYLGEFVVGSIRARARRQAMPPLQLNTPLARSWVGTKEKFRLLGRTITILNFGSRENHEKVRYAVFLLRNNVLYVRLFYDQLVKLKPKGQKNTGKKAFKRFLKENKPKRNSNPFPLAKIVPNKGSIQILQGGAPGLGKRS